MKTIGLANHRFRNTRHLGVRYIYHLNFLDYTSPFYSLGGRFGYFYFFSVPGQGRGRRRPGRGGPAFDKK